MLSQIYILLTHIGLFHLIGPSVYPENPRTISYTYDPKSLLPDFYCMMRKPHPPQTTAALSRTRMYDLAALRNKKDQPHHYGSK